MKKKILYCTICLLIFAGALGGCTSNPMLTIKPDKKSSTSTSDEPEMVVESPISKYKIISMYYKDEKSLLVPITREIETNTMGVAKLAVELLTYTDDLKDNLAEFKLLPTLPFNMKVLGATIDDTGLIVIDLSGTFNQFSSAKAEMVGVTSLVYTLTSFSNINKVQIRIEGKEIDKMKYATKIGSPISPNEINLDLSVKTNTNLSKVMVYYKRNINENMDFLVPVTKLVDSSQNAIDIAMASLKTPKADTGLLSVIPADVEILGVKIQENTAYVNISKTILEIKDEKEQAEIKRAISLTLKEFKEISKIRFFIDGKTMLEGIGSDEILAIPAFVNYI